MAAPVARGHHWLRVRSAKPSATPVTCRATVLLHTAGIAIGWTLRQRGTLLPRVGGAAVALLGAALLAQAI